MKLIKPSFLIKEQEEGLQGIYKQIELAGRTCYKSEDKITEDSAKKFVEAMIKSKHYSMLEHGTVYLHVSKMNRLGLDKEYNKLKKKYSNNPYSKCVELSHILGLTDHLMISTNYRVLIENNWLDDLKYLCEPTKHHEKRVTVKFICDRAISHQLVRSRSMSFAQESQRYCNYFKDKHGGEVSFIIPSWINDLVEGNTYNWESVYDNNLRQTEGLSELSTRFIMSCCYSEAQYLIGIEKGWTPQQARAVLPNATKTEVVMTGFISDYKHFFELRALGTTGAPHPDMKALVEPLMEEFKERNWL